MLNIYIGLFCFLVVVISIFGYAYYARPSRFFKRVVPGAPGAEAHAVAGAPLSPAIHVFEEIGAKAPIPRASAASARHDLSAAGFRADSAVTVYFGIKIVVAAAVALAVFLLAARWMNVVIPLKIAFVAIAAFSGYVIPGLFLEHLIAVRQEKLRLALPDVLDLLVVCVEAGQGLDQALMTVGRELESTHPELCKELSLVNLEMRAGLRRAEALHNLAQRTGERELRKLVAILVQTDRFGTSMSEALRTHSVFMRRLRRLSAEERAGKVGVKLVFPIFFFILPSMLVIAAGPGVLQVITALFPLMRGYHGY